MLDELDIVRIERSRHDQGFLKMLMGNSKHKKLASFYVFDSERDTKTTGDSDKIDVPL